MRLGSNAQGHKAKPRQRRQAQNNVADRSIREQVAEQGKTAEVAPPRLSKRYSDRAIHYLEHQQKCRQGRNKETIDLASQPDRISRSLQWTLFYKSWCVGRERPLGQL